MTNTIQQQRHVAINSHAVNKYIERVDDTLDFGHARVALFRVWMIDHNATEWEVRTIRAAEPDGEVVYRIAETCYGLIVMPIRRGRMMTCWRLENR